uniref:Protein CASP n=1 Tax=Steinernema glaseri TaxID=37863 RepID=A0A1I7ZNT8_9BILA
MQAQIATLRSHREALQRQKDDIAMEFEAFKSKARYVLEQQKTSPPADSVSESDYLQVKAQLESEVQTNASLR